jgi:hypothetical protein
VEGGGGEVEQADGQSEAVGETEHEIQAAPIDVSEDAAPQAGGEGQETGAQAAPEVVEEVHVVAPTEPAAADAAAARAALSAAIEEAEATAAVALPRAHKEAAAEAAEAAATPAPAPAQGQAAAPLGGHDHGRGSGGGGGSGGLLALGAVLSLAFAAFVAWHGQWTEGSIDWHPQWGSGSLVSWSSAGGVAPGGGEPFWPLRLDLNGTGLPPFPLKWGSSALSKAEIDGFLSAVKALPIPAGELRALLPRLRAWAEADDGAPTYMLHLVQLEPKLRKLPGAPTIEGGPAEAARAYEAGLVKTWLGRASYPLFAGAAGPSLLKLAPKRDWSRVLLVRYASRRTFLRLLTDPAHVDLLPYKLASFDLDLLPATAGAVLPEAPWVVGAGLLALFLSAGWLRASARAARLAARLAASEARSGSRLLLT